MGVLLLFQILLLLCRFGNVERLVSIELQSDSSVSDKGNHLSSNLFSRGIVLLLGFRLDLFANFFCHTSPPQRDSHSFCIAFEVTLS
jgi:hypothetical protein